MALLGAFEAAGDGADDFFHREPVIDVQLGGVADFEVADAFGEIVLRQLEGDAFEAFGVLHHGASVGETLQVFRQVGVVVFENEFAQSFFGVGGQLDVLRFGQFDQGGQPQRAVEVDVEVGLGDGAEEVGVHGIVTFVVSEPRSAAK